MAGPEQGTGMCHNRLTPAAGVGRGWEQRTAPLPLRAERAEALIDVIGGRSWGNPKTGRSPWPPAIAPG